MSLSFGRNWMNGMKSHGGPLKSSRSDVGANPLNQSKKEEDKNGQTAALFLIPTVLCEFEVGENA